MRSIILILFLVLGLPGTVSAQMGEFLQAISGGGSWINLDIVDGRASYLSPVLPLPGLTVSGCFQVWDGHSGTWTVAARDVYGDQAINAAIEPGEPVKFDYTGGMQAQLEVTVEWSEPRDTTLFMWIGLQALASKDADVCVPTEGGGS